MRRARAAGLLVAVLVGVTVSGPGQSEAVPPALAATESCTQTIAVLPTVIASPGRWCLAGPLHLASETLDAITVQADGVEIDGRGHSITGPRSGNRGIIAYDVVGLTVRDVSVHGFGTALLVADTTPADMMGRTEGPRRSRDVAVHGLVSQDAAFQGVHVRADDFSITDSRILRVGHSTREAHAFATGVYAVGRGCDIRGNVIEDLVPSGNGEGVGIALYDGGGCRVARNTITFRGRPTFGRRFGFWVRPGAGEDPVVAGNQVRGADYAYGPFGVYYGNSAEVTCALFVTRVVPPNDLIDHGGNIAVRSGDCPDDTRASTQRYAASPGPEAAYAVAVARQEAGADPVDVLTWIVVAARLGHELARPVDEDPVAHLYSLPTARLAAVRAGEVLGEAGRAAERRRRGEPTPVLLAAG